MAAAGREQTPFVDQLTTATAEEETVGASSLNYRNVSLAEVRQYPLCIKAGIEPESCKNDVGQIN